MALLGLPAIAGAGGGGGLPGFDNSSSAASHAGPVTVGGLTFAPSNSQTLVAGAIALAAVFVVLAVVKGAK